MLRINISSSAGERTVESDRTELVLGRGEGVDVLIDDPAASRNHCALRVREGRLQLIDLGSQNGVHLGERRVSDARLRAGDNFRIGKTTITVTSLPGATDAGPGRSAAASGLALQGGTAAPPPGTTGPAAPIPHGARHDFAREIRRTLARTPWYITSLIVHLIALFLLSTVPYTVKTEWPNATIKAARSNDLPALDTDIEEVQPPELERPEEILDDRLDDEGSAEEAPAQAGIDSPDRSTLPSTIGTRNNFRLPSPLHVKPKVKQPGKRVDTTNIGREHGTVRDIVERGTGTGLRNLRAQNGERIVVVRGDFDKMENILDLYQIKYTLIDRDRFLKGSFPKAYVVCINCARKPLGRRANRLASRVQRMVRGKGVWLITSDWSVEPYLTLGWPGHVTKIERLKRRQADTTITVTPAHQSPLLAGVFGRRSQTRWWLEESSVFFRCSKRANVLIRSDDMFERYGARDVCFDFRDARGRVLHLLGHFWQEDGNVAGLVAMHKLILNFLIERFSPGG